MLSLLAFLVSPNTSFSALYELTEERFMTSYLCLWCFFFASSKASLLLVLRCSFEEITEGQRSHASMFSAFRKTRGRLRLHCRQIILSILIC